jgi:hypothetical protein
MDPETFDWLGQNFPSAQQAYCSTHSYPMCCFKSGSRILTAEGEIAVEDLKLGDKVISLENEELPVKWIGWRRIRVEAHPEPAAVGPVRIARGALGENAPSRDLHVSPHHAMYLNGVLIRASVLVNGENVTQGLTGEVVYYHVELDRHAVIFAEGAATESFLEREGSRSYFANSTDAIALHPEFGAGLGRERRERDAAGRIHDWTFARLAGAGDRLYRVAARYGLGRVAGVAAKLNGLAMQRLTGTVAPYVSFGPVLDGARRQIADRAHSRIEPEALRRQQAA